MGRRDKLPLSLGLVSGRRTPIQLEMRESQSEATKEGVPTLSPLFGEQEERGQCPKPFSSGTLHIQRITDETGC